MLMFYFSSDHAEVEQVRKELVEAGIPCEVQNLAPLCEGSASQPSEEVLWIHNDTDAHRALMLCVTHGLGFAKRTLPPDWFAEREPAEESLPDARMREGRAGASKSV